MNKKLFVIFTSIIFLTCSSFCKAENIYYYLEKLPPSISFRDYFRFKESGDLIEYVDSCKKALVILENPDETTIEKYISLLIEIHDLTDQFPDIFKSDKPTSATLQMLKAVENLYGIDSEMYSRIFADYLLYDDKNKKTNDLVQLIAVDGFNCDSTYTRYLKNKVNLNNHFVDGAFANLFTTKNSLEKIKPNSELLKELLLFNLVSDIDINSLST